MRCRPSSLRSTPVPLLLAALVSVVLALAGCAIDRSAPAATSVGSGAASPVASPTDAAQFPLTVIDDAGREVALPAAPDRIVSLAPSNSEIVCALGACDRLVGVTDFDDYPPEVAEVDDVVIAAQVDVERVVAAQPDLVLAGGNEHTPTPVIEQLIALDLPVMTLYAESLEEVYADIQLVGTALAAGDEAAGVVEEMRARADAVVEAVSGADRPRTFYEISVFEGVIYTAGDDSFLASLLELAGTDPVVGDRQSFAIQLEELVAADPEVILLGDASYDPSVTPESVAARAGWEGMTAVQTGRVLPYPHDVVTTRPGPRIVEGLEHLARAIHPDRLP